MQALAAPVQDTEAHYKGIIEGVQKLFDDKRAQPASVQPVAHINQNGVIHEAGYEWGPTNTLTPLYTTPPAAQPAQPAQEPDVVMHCNSNTWTINNSPPKGSDDVNLYYAHGIKENT
jgi:hypothetical protein